MKRLILIFAVLFLACGYAIADNRVIVDNLKYIVYDDGTAAWIAGLVGSEPKYTAPEQDTIIVADFVQFEGKNYPVTSIVARSDNDVIRPLYYHNYILGSNVRVIERSAFMYFSILSLDLRNVEIIKSYAFRNCYFHRPLDLKKVKNIENDAFRNSVFKAWYEAWVTDVDAELPPINFRNVEQIGDAAFKDAVIQLGTKSITLPETITSMGKVAFYKTQINEVIVNTDILSDSLFATDLINGGGYNSLDDTFWNYQKEHQVALNVVLNGSYDTIPQSCFRNRVLASNPLPQSFVIIGADAFNHCYFPESSIVFPNTLRTIANSAFRESHILSVTFPSSLETIENYAFYRSTLENVDFGGSAPNFDITAFEQTRWLMNAELGMLYSGTTAVRYVGTPPEQFTIRDGTTRIETGCFSSKTSLVKVYLPESLEEIGSSAFSSCSNLTDVVLPANNNLKTIGSNAFYNCPKLENIVNFDNVEYLGISAFVSGLDDITATTPAWYINQAPGLVYVGKVALRYRGDMPENTTITLKPNTTMIAEYCFFNQSNLVAIDCGDSLKYISESPFLSCTNLKKFTLNNGNLHLENIAKNAFNSCSFNELHITDLASWLYSYDTPPTTLDGIGKYDDQYPEIYYNANYDNLVIKAANVYVNGSKLEQLNVPEGVTTIHSNMVEGCSSLKSVHIPSTCSRITGNSGVFFNSPLETITIAEGNTAYRVRDNALYRKVDFYRDTMIVENPYYSPFVTIYKFTDWILEKGSKSTSVIQPVAKIVDYAFSRTRNPNLLTFEEGTKKIGKYAFSHCNFKKVVLPHSLIELGDYAFNWCNNLEEVVIGPQKPTFGHQPFVNCAKLSTIRLYIKDPSVFTGNASSSVFPAGCVIYVPRGSGESYRSTPYFTGYEIREFDDAPKGDVDGNGVVDGIDLNTMINFILGKSSPSVTQLEIADFDGDGAIDGTDLNQMINTILGQ